MLMMLALRLAGIRAIALGPTATLLWVQSDPSKGSVSLKKVFQLMLMMLALRSLLNPSNDWVRTEPCSVFKGLEDGRVSSKRSFQLMLMMLALCSSRGTRPVALVRTATLLWVQVQNTVNGRVSLKKVFQLMLMMLALLPGPCCGFRRGKLKNKKVFQLMLMMLALRSFAGIRPMIAGSNWNLAAG